ncbi:HU family DNA-binding protein [bacterium]|nr:MAG: HU family DNA-binding protein [bacterium]MBV6517386.1 DNA-binding protein HU [Planctomycetota bacterium]MCQ3951622.1 HU family DNA-binding protein [Planctomycetota bacterium]RIK63205.1 MAG: HU family DNA-binding protein [Planctomycetota bacterium]HRJ77938.1 HU family DNA-binding protein [Planctomycetota bacterium]
MNKAQLVDILLKNKDAGFESKAAAERAFDGVVAAIKEGVSKSGKAQIIGFGTFSKRTRGARNGRNPQTGEAMKIPAFTTVGFKVGKEFKDDVNKKGKK